MPSDTLPADRRPADRPLGEHLPDEDLPGGPGRAAAACSARAVVPGQVVALTGQLDVRSAADVRLLLADALEAGAGDLLVDLAGLEAVDAPGLGVLVGAHRRAGRAGRVLVLRDVTAPVARLLALTRLDRVLRVVRTAQQA